MAQRRIINNAKSYFQEDILIVGSFYPNGTGAPLTGSSVGGALLSGALGALTGSGAAALKFDSQGRNGGIWTVTRDTNQGALNNSGTGSFLVSLTEKYNFSKSADAWYSGPSGSAYFAYVVFADMAGAQGAPVVRIQVAQQTGSLYPAPAADLTPNQGCIQFMLVAGNSAAK